MLTYLIKRSRWLLLAASLASILAGICGVMLVTQINAALTASGSAREQLPWSFAMVVCGALVCGVCSKLLFERLRLGAMAELRAFLSGRVLDVPLRRLEEIGAAKIQSALADHATDVARFFVSVPNILTNGVVVGGCMIYLAMLSAKVFLVAMAVIVLGSAGYLVAQRYASRHLNASSLEQDRLFGHFRSLTDGAKELRQNRGKRERFAAQVLGTSIDKVTRHRMRGMAIFEAAAGWGNFLIYGFVGLVLFVLVGDASDRERVMTGFALVFVYMVTPLQSLLDWLPEANLARVSSARIEALTQRMVPDEAPADPLERSSRFDSIELRGLKHCYYHEQSGEVFELGPIDFHFTPGEIVFLVGGNGSGKTTLAKLIAGLYTPESGALLLNGMPVDHGNRDAYRQLFSTVFSDFHLFEQLLELGGQELDEEGNRLIEKLHLQHKVRMKDGAFSTQELSQGQRKRLSLIVAYLEDRPFLVFDEWAADQDPVFKRFFYQEVLPELRDMGKAVLVISHDDRYFQVADRIIHLDSGKVRSVDISHLRGVRRLEANRLSPARAVNDGST
ncbi:MAG: cyclic peptide export ABC transporter [Rubrivivax sp.]|nr:MAG: cyclic peptide export ABC transporter [Rubrivivax sp.]